MKVIKEKDINLIPEKQMRDKQKRMAIFYTSMVLWVVIFICTVNIVFQGAGYGYLTYVNNVALKEIERLAPIKQKDDDVHLKTAYVSKRVEYLAQLRQDDKQLVLYIEKLEKALPMDFSVNSISVGETGEVEIRGTAINEVLAADAVAILRNNELVVNADIASIDMSKQGKVDIAIKGVQGKI